MAKTVQSFNPPGTVWPCRTSIGMLVLSWARAVSTRQRWWDQRSEVGHTGAVPVAARRHRGDLAGSEAWAADVGAYLSAPSGLWQGRQRFPGEPRGAGGRFQPRHQLVVHPEGVEPPGPWDAVDRRRAPPPRRDQGPAGRAVDNLTRAHAQHGVHASLDEAGERRLGAQPPIRHEPIPGGEHRVHLRHLGEIVGQEGRDPQLQEHAGARREPPQEMGQGKAAPRPLRC